MAHTRFGSRRHRRLPADGLHRGFSVIELLVALAIVSILAAAGIYFTQDRRGADVRANTSSLMSALRAAQSLALNSGTSVYLRSTGGGPLTRPQLEWGFRTLDASNNPVYGDVQGSWAIPDAEYKYVSVGVGTSDFSGLSLNPDPASLTAITSHATNTSTIANTTFFTGSGTNTTYFYGSNGVINSEFLITVVGKSNGGVSIPKNPVGLIIVNPNSGLTAFYKASAQDSTSPWRRL